jgi:secreted trypsin-like serine protease
VRAMLLAMALIATAAVGTAPHLAGAAQAGSADPPRAEVIGGVQADGHEFPFVVRLSNGCSGSLVRSQYVLTAAHCVAHSGRTRSLGITAGSADLGSSERVSVRSLEVRRASGFRSVTYGDDWAVIKLARELDVRTVAPASDSALDSGPFTVVGWGITRESGSGQQRHLRETQVPFVSDATCGRLFSAAGYRIVPAEMLCAGDLNRGGRDACQGDSGGPLLRRDSGRWVQVGIVSWGVGCGRAQFPGVYTQVSTFGSDISQAIEELRSAS